MVKKVLILGKDGMLGKELTSVFTSDTSYTTVAWNRNDLDVSNFILLTNKITNLKPDYIINTVAYNNVDLCEEDVEFEKALVLNKQVPKILAELSKSIGAILIHFSTDYVFGDTKKLEGGYNEEAVPSPHCRYGLSKFFGEEEIKLIADSYYIIRLSRLFGNAGSVSGKKSFFEAMITLSDSKKELQVVDDEISCFTYVVDLASVTKYIIDSKKSFGVYHVINQGSASWYDALSVLFIFLGKKTYLQRVQGRSFLRKASRPQYSVLENTKIPQLRHYQEALKECYL
jgi:dTDP-4-dehydrorhamnose reductase